MLLLLESAATEQPTPGVTALSYSRWEIVTLTGWVALFWLWNTLVEGVRWTWQRGFS